MRSIRPLPWRPACCWPAAASRSAAEPVLRRVLLSTGGVGYFGYGATPEADGRLRLTVPLAQVDDILKSLTVLAADGTVRAVSLLGPTPLADLFRDVPFGEGDLVDLPSLLLACAGPRSRSRPRQPARPDPHAWRARRRRRASAGRHATGSASPGRRASAR